MGVKARLTGRSRSTLSNGGPVKYYPSIYSVLFICPYVREGGLVPDMRARAASSNIVLFTRQNVEAGSACYIGDRCEGIDFDGYPELTQTHKKLW